jgi:hypothetical protein
VVSPDAAVDGVDVAIPGAGSAIAFVSAGEAVLRGTADTFSLARGAAVYLSGEARVHLSGDATVFLATRAV